MHFPKIITTFRVCFRDTATNNTNEPNYNDMSDKISRGDFLKRSGLAAAGMMMGGMASAQPASSPHNSRIRTRRSVSQSSAR